MSVGAKLNVAFCSLIILLGITTGITFFNLSKIEEKTEEAFGTGIEQMQTISDILIDTAIQGLYARALVIENTDENRESLLSHAATLDENILKLKEMSNTPIMEDYWNQLNADNDEFNIIMHEILAAIDEGNNEVATTLAKTDLQNVNAEILNTAMDMSDFQTEQIALIKEETEFSIVNSRISSIIVLVISIAISVFLILYVRKTITTPLKTLMNEANIIADGDLSQSDVVVKSRDEIGQLATVFNTMKDSLRSLIKNVQTNSEQLTVAAGELSASTEEISATTEDVTRQVNNTAEAAQGSSRAAGESAIAMEETAQGVQRIAEASQTLHSSSLDASETATHGKEIIEHAKKQMDAINISTATVNELVQKLAKQTEEIENITKVITDISDQTNLLALNASIEAARAGEHGKGFAVVANEVKNLAEESKESANSIVALTVEIKTDTENVERAVENSLMSVKDGVKIINEAGESFQAIVGAVNTMTSQIQEISATSEQISASAEEVSASVNEISNSAEISASSIDTIAAAMEEQVATMQEVNGVASSLNDSVKDLQAEIQRFKV